MRVAAAAMVSALVLVTGPAHTAAQQELLDLSPYIDAPGGVVRVPAGNYKAATTTVVRSQPLVLVADGPVVVDGGVNLEGTTNLTLKGSFLMRGPVQIRSSSDITLDGIEITNPGVSGGTGVIVNHIRGESGSSDRVRITAVYIHDTYDDAIRIGAAREVMVEGVVAERIFDVPRSTCGGEKCHDDAVQVMGPSTGIVIRDNDLEANVIFKTDLGDIDAELSGNRIHDDHNAGVHVHELDGTELRLTMRTANYVWNHPQGSLRITGSPEITGQELIVATPPPAEGPPRPPEPPTTAGTNAEASPEPATPEVDAKSDGGDGLPVVPALIGVVLAAILAVALARRRSKGDGHASSGSVPEPPGGEEPDLRVGAGSPGRD